MNKAGTIATIGAIICVMPLILFLNPMPKDMGVMVKQYFLIASVQFVGCLFLGAAYYINNKDERDTDNKE